ncbi:hypothetical protein WISP_123543 [Willisornis vidua]|uniref:ATS20 metalloproteinase n=1 Tax=Willisornis vidua TaxID=1566151 RepID=A0ABQ9CXL1_9PASS|nr:hypothetical protein WISP_123543 [Willisornis vidua]
MHGARRLVGLLCPLSLLATASWAFHFHPGQETLVKQLSSYEIITPVRVNEFGEVFPHTHHFRRRKRSLEAPREPAAFRTHYQLSAYGQVFRLNLSADAGFVSAQYTVVHVGAPQTQSPDLRHCFYRGHVNAQETHVAVFSICGGLMGTFKAHDGEYILEPLMKADGGEHEDEHNKPHLIYKHEELKKKYQKTHKPCEVSDKELKNTLLRSTFGSLNEESSVLQKSLGSEYALNNLSLEDGGNPHSRKKRFLSYPRYVEVMVTADAKMVRHHGQNLQHYILTLMSIVAAIYKDASIGNLINIVIVKLIVIHNEREGPAITFNAATTLRNFCIWQQSQNTLDDSHPSHHDTAVLITREDICRAREKCDTLGLAELGTMCDPLRSCSVSEENGLSAAFTIAHELGHVFNVPHDDSFKCKEAGIKNQYHVMAPTLNYHTSPWTWSKCSQKYITEFLDTGYGECLLDKPSGRIYDLSLQLPGSMYDVNKQCELTFGIGSQVCPYLHCRHGICMSREMEMRPVDGEWGPWGPYSSCSRTCGGGIKSITRLCNRPEPRNGGKYCVGRRMKFRSCNTDSCPKGQKDFREQQCSEFDGKHFNINGLTSAVRWLPKYSGSYNVVVNIPKGATNIDIQQHSYSGKPEDDNYLGNLYNPDVRYSFNIPIEDGSDLFTWDPYGPWQDCSRMCQGIRRRRMTCIHKSDRVAVSDQRCEFIPTVPSVFEECNTECELRWHSAGKSDCTSRCGPGYRSIEIRCMKYSISKGLSAPVDDKYCADQQKPPAREPCHGDCMLTSWHYTEWSECPVTCGNGMKHRQVWCQLNDEQLRDDFCNPNDRPESVTPCELHECASWQVGPWGSCSVTCGHGYQLRAVKCATRTYHVILSDDRECNAATRPRDNQCSSTCAGGFHRRVVVCQDEEGRSASYCDEATKPPESRHCDSGPCPQWNFGNWGECSVSCGVGIQQRDIYCQLTGLGQVSEAMCSHDTRPASKRHCWLPACLLYHWLADEWEDCSASFRRKKMYRKVKCVNENRLQVDESFCDPAIKPSSSKTCRVAPSKYVVFTGELSKCSASCGFGYQQRITYCVGIHSVRNQRAHGLQTVAYQECPVESSPYIYKCNINGCSQAATWRVGKWTKCSVSCGVGLKERTVECMTENGLSSDLCLPHLKPDARRICHEEECEVLTTCKDMQIKKGIRKDGEYLLNIKGRMIKIYCSGMHLENPKEYLTLVKGEVDNFSEVYGFRLQNPYECPFNGSRRQDCACRNDYLAAGFTIFSKIRFDVTSMQIKTTDFLFAQTILGRAVPFATAGDCYSAARCPQGQFSINLAGTGLRLSSAVRWIAQGNYATADIHKSHDGTKIYGRCGGFCGKCVPSTVIGLQLQIQ